MNAPETALPLIVEAPCGRLQGLSEAGLAIFKGIPYAASTAGERRWRPAEPIGPWAGTRDATHFAPICPQAPTPLENIIGSTMGEAAEDCLALNVWSPSVAGKRPVMVWFHGGAFILGAGSQTIYNGKFLARAGDVVVVTVNYRLGCLGWLNLKDATNGAMPGSGTEGLSDQIAALEWVQRNIAAFGGDPQNVTIFGESAGAMSVSALLAAAGGRDLFHKAIAQSGGGHIGYDRDRAARVARALLDALGLAPGDAKALAGVPPAALIKAQVAVLAAANDAKDPRRLGPMPFQPTIDGALLRERPIQAIRAGAAKGIPLMSGTTKEEWRLFTGANPTLRFLRQSGLERRVRRAVGDEAAASLLAGYADGSPFERWNAIQTDRVFGVPAERLLEAQGTHAPTYLYRFDHRSPLMGGIFGACHALELGFMWGTHGVRIANKFFGTGPKAEALAAAMMEAWGRFAHEGAPRLAAGPTWTPYDARERATMIFDKGLISAAEKPNETHRSLWRSVPDAMLGA